MVPRTDASTRVPKSDANPPSQSSVPFLSLFVPSQFTRTVPRNLHPPLTHAQRRESALLYPPLVHL